MIRDGERLIEEIDAFGAEIEEARAENRAQQRERHPKRTREIGQETRKKASKKAIIFCLGAAAGIEAWVGAASITRVLIARLYPFLQTEASADQIRPAVGLRRLAGFPSPS